MTVQKTNSKFSSRQLTLIALMTALLCILGPLTLPLPFSPVPISLAILGIYLSVFILGMRYSLLSYLLYLLLGLVGLPVFSGFSGGFGTILGPTGGYLIGYAFLILLSGFFIEQFPENKVTPILGMALGLLLCYSFGTTWLAIQTNTNFLGAFSIGVLPFLPGDIAKIILAATIGPRLRQQTNLIFTS